MNPTRALYESWLFDALEGRLPGWKNLLLTRALRRDLGLRCLALELLEFECEPPETAWTLDLRPRLRERILAEAGTPERPLFPSAWIPAGAIAALLITALVALNVRTGRAPQGEASYQPAVLLETALPAPVTYPVAAPLVQPVHASGPAALTANASVQNARSIPAAPSPVTTAASSTPSGQTP